jgi:hypothetical protein
MTSPEAYAADPVFTVHSYLNTNIQRAKEWAYQEQVVNEPFNFFFNGDQTQKLFTGVLQPKDTDQEHLRYPLQ